MPVSMMRKRESEYAVERMEEEAHEHVAVRTRAARANSRESSAPGKTSAEKTDRSTS